jgi:hypothetical protein
VAEIEYQVDWTSTLSSVRPEPRLAEAVVVEPGDTQLIRLDPSTSLQQAELVKAKLAEVLPGVRIIVVAAAQFAVVKGGGDRG